MVAITSADGEMKRVKHKSRAGKKNIRKNSANFAATEEFGNALKADHELFFVDTAKQKVGSNVPGAARMRMKQTLKAMPAKQKIAAPIPFQMSRGKFAKRHKGDRIAQSEADIAANAADALPIGAFASTASMVQGQYDLWDDGPTAPGPNQLDTFENIARVARKQPDASHFTTREVKRKADAPRLLGFQLPHEGSSYRPTAGAQRELLAQAITNEQDRLDNNQVHRVKLAGGYGSTVVPDASLLEDNSKQQNEALESKEGTVVPELGNGEEGVDDDFWLEGEEAKVGYGPPVENKKKTKAQRNKDKRRKEIEADLKAAKAAKLFKVQLSHIGSIKKQVDTFQAGQASDLAARKEFEEEKAATLPKRLGKMKYEAPFVDVLMSSEVPDTLRTLPAAPTLLRSLYKGMQARNLIEPRLPTKKAGKRRYKIKEFNKRGFSSTTTVKSIENQFEDQAFSAKVSKAKKVKPNY